MIKNFGIRPKTIKSQVQHSQVSSLTLVLEMIFKSDTCSKIYMRIPLYLVALCSFNCLQQILINFLFIFILLQNLFLVLLIMAS